MVVKVQNTKLVPFLILIGIVVFFLISIAKGLQLVSKSEKELNPQKQITEAKALEYSLKEVDAATGELRWKLKAREGSTENNLQNAVIKDINAETYKDNMIVFKLTAPFAKANTEKKEIYLYGGVTAIDEKGDFILNSNQIALGMGAAIEAKKGFTLNLKGGNSIKGEKAFINEGQTKFIITKLTEAVFKEIILSGEEVTIEKEKNGELIQATITNGGKVIIKNENQNILKALNIKWVKSGEVEATNNVSYISEGKTFMANYLLLKPDKKVFARNKVIIEHGKTRCFGESLSFENNSVTITGSPKAIQGNKQISANKIVYDINSGKVQAIGNVRTIVINNISKS